MFTHITSIKIKTGLFVFLIAFLFPLHIQAQRLGHGASRGGGRTMSHPAASTHNVSRPKSINGGHTKTNTRDFSKPSTKNAPATRNNTAGNKKIGANNTIKNNSGNSKRTSNIK
ncbi:MAG: hypothetical protein KDD18_10475, partial [Mangrovimonas sp.]|nr:hypothetical protein [Mangrovimonas sp.]